MPGAGSRKATVAIGIIATTIVAIALLAPWFRPTPQYTGSSQPEIMVSYSWEYTDRIARELEPPEGEVFLVLRLTVENRGYANFTADPFRDMYITVNAQSYNVSIAYFFLQNRFKPANITNGTSAGGEVLFQVPAGTTSFEPRWRNPNGADFNIRFLALGQTK